MLKRSAKLALIALIAVAVPMAVLLVWRSQQDTGPVTTLSGETMGTNWSIRLHSNVLDADAPNWLRTDVESVLARINSRLSTWDPDSEVSRFNRFDGSDWFEVSVETRDLVRNALDISARTDGAFDVTVGPLVDLWGFGAVAVTGAPDPAEVWEVSQSVGWELIETRASPPALRKQHPEAEIDLSAIARGYTVDRLAMLMEMSGVRNYRVQLDGEWRARGVDPEGRPWAVQISTPSPESTTERRLIELDRESVATTGDHEHFVVDEGQRYSHAIDPRTGLPVQPDVASATVVHESAMMADAFATAIMVMGSARGARWAENRGIKAYIIAHDMGGFREIVTSTFPKEPR